MRFQKQAFKHNPEKGVYGDCQRTVLACMLDLERDTVPNFGIHIGNEAEWHKMLDQWLQTQGYVLVETPYTGECPEDVLRTQMHRMHQYYLFSGSSKNGTNHVVIAKGNKIVWDTAIDDSGITGPDDQGYYWIGHLVQTRFVEQPGDHYRFAVNESVTACQGTGDGTWNKMFKANLEKYGLALTTSNNWQTSDKYPTGGPYTAPRPFGDMDGWPDDSFMVYKDHLPI